MCSESLSGFIVFEMGLHCVAQASLKLTIVLNLLPEYWDYRCVPSLGFAVFVVVLYLCPSEQQGKPR